MGDCFLYIIVVTFVRRHREHPFRVRGGEGHDPAVQPEGVQPRVSAPNHNSVIVYNT